jgi:hypothetical protein
LFCFVLFFFFFGLLIGYFDVAILAIHPQVELMKFGYQLERSVHKFKNLATIFPQLAGGWNLWSNKYGNFRKKNPWNLARLVLFFPQKSFVWVALAFFFSVATSPREKKQKENNK